MSKQDKSSSWKVYFVLFSIYTAFIFVLTRLFFISVIDHEKYLKMAQTQHWASFELPAKRGSIFFADGYPLAATKISYLVFAEPKKIKKEKVVAKKLCEAFQEKDQRECRDEVIKKLSLDFYWLALRHGASEEIKEKIEKMKLPGIGFEEEHSRIYPEKKLAASVTGFVARDESGKERGYFGLEGFYNGNLEGRPGRVVEEKDALGAPIPHGGYRKIPALDGRDLVISLDRSLQFLVEKALAAGVKKYGAEFGTVVIENPFTGEIAVMANYPSFDPNEIAAASKEKVGGIWRNHAIASTYEPGSVLKALTVAAGIDTGSISSKSSFYDGGPLEIGGYKIDTWDGKHYGEESVSKILQHSNNVGAALIAQKIGARHLREYFLKFGLGRKTGIDLEGEDTGEVKPLGEWYPVDLATASFGQGVSTTPLQMVSAFSAIVNGGVLVKPNLIKEFIDDGRRTLVESKKKTRVISSSTARQLVRLLTEAVSGGESKFFNLPNYVIAGKTGTAQIPVGGKYDPSLTNATFVGFFPSNPIFVMLVRLEKPQSSPYAAETAVPLWMEIAKELTLYWNIAPDK